MCLPPGTFPQTTQCTSTQTAGWYWFSYYELQLGTVFNAFTLYWRWIQSSVLLLCTACGFSLQCFYFVLYVGTVFSAFTLYCMWGYSLQCFYSVLQVDTVFSALTLYCMWVQSSVILLCTAGGYSLQCYYSVLQLGTVFSTFTLYCRWAQSSVLYSLVQVGKVYCQFWCSWYYVYCRRYWYGYWLVVPTLSWYSMYVCRSGLYGSGLLCTTWKICRGQFGKYFAVSH